MRSPGTKSEVTEHEIEAAIDLSASRAFREALARYQEMLDRAQNQQVLFKVLYGIITCSTSLSLDDVRQDAISQLKQLPDFEISQAFIAFDQARAFDDLGKYQEALDLIDENLRSPVLYRDDFKDWGYEHLYFRGRFLERLSRCEEALAAFDLAQRIEANGKYQTLMLIEQSNCLLALDRFEEAYDSASKVLHRGDEEMATRAMQAMAECRLWQKRASEALELYAAILKRLPCRSVQEERIQTGITNAMSYLESAHPPGKPS